MLTTFSRLEKEALQDATEQADFVGIVRRLFEKTEQNISASLEDNANKNRLACMYGKKFIRCHIHRLDLTLQELLETYMHVIIRVQMVMKKLSRTIHAALLQKNNFCCQSLQYNASELNISYALSIRCAYRCASEQET